MVLARMLAYITGTVDQELLLRNEYLAAENHILKAQIKGRLLLCDGERATLAASRDCLPTGTKGCPSPKFCPDRTPFPSETFAAKKRAALKTIII
jgi:hypothetical protein